MAAAGRRTGSRVVRAAARLATNGATRRRGRGDLIRPAARLVRRLAPRPPASPRRRGRLRLPVARRAFSGRAAAAPSGRRSHRLLRVVPAFAGDDVPLYPRREKPPGSGRFRRTAGGDHGGAQRDLALAAASACRLATLSIRRLSIRGPADRRRAPPGAWPAFLHLGSAPESAAGPGQSQVGDRTARAAGPPDHPRVRPRSP